MKKIFIALFCCVALVGCKSDVGCIEGDCENGQGTYSYAYGEWKGDKYVGEYKDGLRNGQGTYSYANGDKYVGEWKDDRKNGQGTWTDTNGNKFVGEFKYDKRNGKGTLTRADGAIYPCGLWKDDKPVK